MKTNTHSCFFHRRANGNMLLVALLSFGLMALGLFVVLAFYLILSEQKRGQAQCDDIALDLTKSLNEGNRIGQMNETVEHARELVYLSRQDLINAYNASIPDCLELADLLLNESIESSKAVEKERKNQIDIAVNNCRERAIALYDSRTTTGIRLLPWFIEDQFCLQKTRFATANDLSNVSGPQAIKELHKFDLEKNYIEKISNLYYGNINAKLPPPDAQLAFYLSALPARWKILPAPPAWPI